MKEHPILFNSEMVKAVLDDKKTQTRRVLKVQPPTDKHQLCQLIDTTDREKRKHRGKHHWAIVDGLNISQEQEIYFKCPYGQVGGRLWVRETWCAGVEWDTEKPSEIDPLCGGNDIFYLADGEKTEGYGKTRPNIFMPKWASRIKLEITAIRVERVQDITHADIFREGLDVPKEPKGEFPDNLKRKWIQLWNGINGARGYGWPKNPWVWVVEFKRT